MGSPDDPPCIERESDEGAPLQGGPWPTRCCAQGRALGWGVSRKLAACRSPPGGAWGRGRARDEPALGGEGQCRVGGSLAAPEAPGGGQRAPGRAREPGQRPGAFSVSGGGAARPDPRWAPHRAARPRGRAAVAAEGAAPKRPPRDEPQGRPCRPGSRAQAGHPGARYHEGHPAGAIRQHQGGPGASRRDAGDTAHVGGQSVWRRPGDVRGARTPAQAQAKTAGRGGWGRGLHGGRTVLLSRRVSAAHTGATAPV
jgi:hypothetical protein